MYGGLDKGGGGVVGSGADPFLSSSTHEQNVDDIVDSAAGDETICCQEEDGTKAFLSARISPVTGEVQVCQVLYFVDVCMLEVLHKH